ncbi:MAG: adenylate/guanylate cyclase domain-containing protein [Terriglobia bacterium]
MATFAPFYDTLRFYASALYWETDEEVAQREADGQVETAKALPHTRAENVRPLSINLRPFLYFPLKISHRVLNLACRAATGTFLLLFILEFPHPAKWDGVWLTGLVHTVGDPIVVRAIVWAGDLYPASIRLTEYFALALAVGAWFLRRGLNIFFVPILKRLSKRPRPARQDYDLAIPTAEEEEEIARVNSERARRRLLKRYQEIADALKGAGRKRCAFLSVDVAGSTQMKESEQEMAVTVTFQAYMQMLEGIFTRHGAWKQSWTPDGVMVCFLDLDMAVAAGQAVLRELRKFNLTQNLLRTRIAVRCGVNAGEVPIFEDSKLEKIAHRVIDVTGHMQKHATPNTLWVSAQVANHLTDKSGFHPVEKQVDGLNVLEWSARVSLVEQPKTLMAPIEPSDNADTWA